jgi:hypothetical protein
MRIGGRCYSATFKKFMEVPSSEHQMGECPRDEWIGV